MAAQWPETSDVSSEVLDEKLDQPSRGRMITFRVVTALVALWLLALNLLGLMELVFEWLPEDTLASMFDEFDAIHRTHYLAIGIISWALVLSILVQLRKPERRFAPMLLLAGAAIGGTIVYGLSGTLGEWLIEEIAMVLVPVALVLILHPYKDRLFSMPSFDRLMAGMAALAAIPWLVFIVDNAWNQFENLSGDPHAEMEHWATAALLGIVVGLAAFLGASGKTGWRLTGWIAAGGSVVFGAHALVFSGLPSSLSAFWAILAIVWGIAFAVMIVRRSRASADAPFEA